MFCLDDATDAVPYADVPVGTSNGNTEFRSDVTATCTCNRQDSTLNYDMSGNKILIIFNHYVYKKTRHYKYVPSTRYGTFADVKCLEKTFQNLGFAVFTHHDLKYKDIVRYLTDVCKKDHTNTSCVAVAIMSHGHGSKVCAVDRMYALAELTEMIRTAPSLAGKPKLFFIQACRAGHTKPYRKKNADNDVTIPMDADCLILYSSYEDYVSYRNEGGSWMMQALCWVVNNYHETLDLANMVVLINRIVASKLKHNQIPVAESKLTKFMKL